NAAAADCPPPSTDQRGAPRPQGGGCDIGAFEVQPAAVITALKMTPRKLRAKKSGPTISSKRKKKPPRGAVVSYRDSRAALTTFTVLKGLPGVRSGKLCVAPKKPAPKHPKRCTRYRAVGKFTHQDVVGANHFKFSGRLKG